MSIDPTRLIDRLKNHPVHGDLSDKSMWLVVTKYLAEIPPPSGLKVSDEVSSPDSSQAFATATAFELRREPLRQAGESDRDVAVRVMGE